MKKSWIFGLGLTLLLTCEIAAGTQVKEEVDISYFDGGTVHLSASKAGHLHLMRCYRH